MPLISLSEAMQALRIVSNPLDPIEDHLVTYEIYDQYGRFLDCMTLEQYQQARSRLANAVQVGGSRGNVAG